MDFVCSSCGLHVTSKFATPSPCLSCGGATWRRLEAEKPAEPATLLGVVEPAAWVYVGEDGDPESPVFQNGWTNVDGTTQIQGNRS